VTCRPKRRMCSKEERQERRRRARREKTHQAPTILECMIALRGIAGHVTSSAKSGQLLPRLTIVLVVHCILHSSMLVLDPISRLRIIPVSFFDTCILNSYPGISFYDISVLLMATNAILNIVGYMLVYMLYQHSVSTIFNRIPPKFPSAAFVSSLGAHIALLRPLEIIFRYLTVRFRVLPDIIVLGEVRCGTTTLCQHLSDVPGCHKPFCLWKHPELDGKETFYFVGHYLGYVAPSAYRMCFPLSVTKWWNERVLGKPFFTYDGCAQYLTSPTAAALIAETYQRAGQDSPVLVACVRDPVDQAISWWRYENNAMEWGSCMGLSEWNTPLRTNMYPPRSVSEALQFSSSTTVQKLYADAENLVKSPHNLSIDGHTRSLDNTDLAIQHRYRMPSWAITWPGGQLSTTGRNGKYVTNIRRYERTFKDYFQGSMVKREDEGNVLPALTYVTVVPIDYMSANVQLRDTMISVMNQAAVRHYRCTRNGEGNPIFHQAEDTMRMLHESVRNLFKDAVKIRRNSGTKLSNADMEPDSADRAILATFFEMETRDLINMTGMEATDFGWHLAT